MISPCVTVLGHPSPEAGAKPDGHPLEVPGQLDPTGASQLLCRAVQGWKGCVPDGFRRHGAAVPGKGPQHRGRPADCADSVDFGRPGGMLDMSLQTTIMPICDPTIVSSYRWRRSSARSEGTFNAKGQVMPSKRLFWTSVIAVGIVVPSRASDAAGLDYLKVKDLTPVKVLSTPQHAPVVLVSDGQPRAKVYVAVDKPSATLDILVKELVTAVKLSTGAELEIVKKMPAGDAPAIVIGDCDRLAGGRHRSRRHPHRGFRHQNGAQPRVPRRQHDQAAGGHRFQRPLRQRRDGVGAGRLLGAVPRRALVLAGERRRPQRRAGQAPGGPTGALQRPAGVPETRMLPRVRLRRAPRRRSTPQERHSGGRRQARHVPDAGGPA